MRTKGLFITGTDTGVGKSIVAAGLVSLARLEGIAAIGVKPVETG
ncbi:MAG: AAA family ATPase, partial [Thermodesulfobacteriota bacterium]